MFKYSNPSGYEGLFELLLAELGVNLDLALMLGQVSESGVNRMISHCSACGESDECRVIISDDGHSIDCPPNFCANLKIIVFIKAQCEGS